MYKCFFQVNNEDTTCPMYRGGSRAAATSKMESFLIIVNSWKPLTIITKHSILDSAAALDPHVIDIVSLLLTNYEGYYSVNMDFC